MYVTAENEKRPAHHLAKIATWLKQKKSCWALGKTARWCDVGMELWTYYSYRLKQQQWTTSESNKWSLVVIHLLWNK